jgi:hypothetical protein
MAVVRCCKVPGCKFFTKVTKGRGGGRGYGMREGNKARGELIQHVKAAHPEAVAALRAKLGLPEK